MKYLTIKEIKEKHKEIKSELANDVSWVVRKGIAIEYIKKILNKEDKILDIGCGAGYFLKQLFDNGFYKIYGIDIDDYLVFPEISKVAKMSFLDVSMEKIPAQDNYFDLVTAFQVMEHLENPFHFIQETQRVLKTGGILMFSIPNSFNLKSRLKFLLYGNLVDYRKDNNHIAFLTKDVFENTVLKYFTIENVFYFGMCISHIPRFFAKFLQKSELFTAKVLFMLKKK